MLPGGCSASPSSKAQPSWAAITAPMVDLPLPDTPAMMTIIDARPLTGSLPKPRVRRLRLLASSSADGVYLNADREQDTGARGRGRPRHRDTAHAVPESRRVRRRPRDDRAGRAVLGRARRGAAGPLAARYGWRGGLPPAAAALQHGDHRGHRPGRRA